METKAIFTAFFTTVFLASCIPTTSPIPITTTLPTPFITVTPTEIQPSVSSTLQATIPSPITLSGEGNTVLTVDKWRGPALIHIKHEGTGEFTAWNFNQKQHLLNFVLITDGNYNGTQVLDFSDNLAFQTHFIEIGATGKWKIEILPFEHGRRVSVPGVAKGTNNDVIFLEGGTPSSVEIAIYDTGSYFVISGVDDNGVLQVSNGTQPFHGVVKIENDLKMLILECTGKWEINVRNEDK